MAFHSSEALQRNGRLPRSDTEAYESSGKSTRKQSKRLPQLSVVQYFAGGEDERLEVQAYADALANANSAVITARSIAASSVALLRADELDRWVALSKKGLYRNLPSRNKLYGEMYNGLKSFLRTECKPPAIAQRQSRLPVQDRVIIDGPIVITPDMGSIAPSEEPEGWYERSLDMRLAPSPNQEAPRRFGRALYLLLPELVPIPETREYGLEVNIDDTFYEQRLGIVDYLRADHGIKVPELEVFADLSATFAIAHLKETVDFSGLQAPDLSSGVYQPTAISFGNPRPHDLRDVA